MALVNSQEVSLAISAETIKTAGVAALAAQLEAIAKQAGDAGPRFTALAAELRKLDQQQVSITGLNAAIESAKAARAAFVSAREQVAVLDKALADAKGAGANRQATALLDAELRKANQALSVSEAGWQKQRAALAAARAAAQAAGVDTRNLGAAQQQLNTQLESTRTALAAQVAAVNAARAAAAARAADLRAQAAEEDRLNAIILANKKKLEQAAQQQLAAEKRAYAEAAAAAQRYAAQTAEINRQIAASMSNAFANVGVRSSQQITAEIRRINESLGTLSRTAGVSGADFDRAFAAAQRRIKELQRELAGTVDVANKLPSALKPVAAAITGMFAVGQIKTYTTDLIRIADEYKNLNARLNITNSSVAGFNASLDDMVGIATRTTSALGGTVQLFTALSRAGAEMGSSQADIARLAETINKANQVAGQSAAAANAAIVQLIQGLQSGVLRGQEFNSMMEQSPRLARALADGLGVTLGALRKMAHAGELTSEVVMAALQSQAKVIDEEYSKLPTTVSNALTNLSTQWTKFVGEIDSGVGATAALSDGIIALSENLATVAEVAAFAGQAVIAAFAVKGLTALKAYIGGLTAAAAATTGLSAATAALAGIAARLGPILRAIGYAAIATEVFDLVGAYQQLAAEKKKQAETEEHLAESQRRVAERLAEISRATGVAVTSMAELDRAVAENRIHFDQASESWKAGADKSVSAITRLGRATADLVEQFEKAGSKKDALDALVKTFDASSVVHVQNFARALDELQSTNWITAAEFKSAWKSALDTLDGAQLTKFASGWEALSRVGQYTAKGLTDALDGVADRLEKLNGAQLAEFQRTLSSLFDAGKISAKEFADFNDKVLAASFTRLGVNAAQAMGTISAESADAIAAFSGIEAALQKTAASAGQVALALEMAFSQSIAKADSLEAIAALEAQLKSLAESGKLGAEGVARITAELDKQRGKVEDQIPGIQSLAEAYRALGIKTQEELQRAAEIARVAFERIQQSGKASAADLEAAFKAYAEAAIAANGGVANETLKAQAAQVGMKIEVDETGKTVVRTMAESKKATEELTKATKDAAGGMGTIGEAAEEAATGLAAAWDEAGNIVSTVAGGASDDIRRVSSATQEWTGSLRSGIQTGESWARLLEARMAAVEASANNVAAAMARLDRQQAELNSSGARGVEDLKLRLIELNGTEEEIARARHERDEANVRRQIALLEIEIKRAAVRGDETNTLRAEIKLLKEQLGLLDQIYKAEQSASRNKSREGSSSGSGGGGRSSSGGGVSAGGVSRTVTVTPAPAPAPQITAPVTINVHGIDDPEKLARRLKPELDRIARLAR